MVLIKANPTGVVTHAPAPRNPLPHTSPSGSLSDCFSVGCHPVSLAPMHEGPWEVSPALYGIFKSGESSPWKAVLMHTAYVLDYCVG